MASLTKSCGQLQTLIEDFNFYQIQVKGHAVSNEEQKRIHKDLRGRHGFGGPASGGRFFWISKDGLSIF